MTIMAMNGSTLFLLLCVILVNVLHSGYSVPHHRSRKIYRGFKSLFCRLRHRKVIFDVNGKAEGCSRTCPADYEERYSLHWGHHCKPVVLPQGCADRFCIQCINGYKWIYTFPANNRCVRKCPTGYTTQNGMCSKCLGGGCTECNGMFHCTKCQGNRALYRTFRGMVTCRERCPYYYKKMKVEGIIKCVRNNLVIAKTTVKPKRPITPKEIFPPGCTDKDCKNCEKRFVKFFVANGGGSHCLDKCPKGYKNLNSVCIACTDRRCASCNSSLAECEKCFTGYAMQLDALNNTVECVRNCPKKHELKIIKNVTVCVIKPEPECPVKNCKRCVRSNLHMLHAGCQVCVKGFKLFRGSFNDHCYASCPSGYFSAERPGTNITICGKCQVPFCNKCTDASTCEECVGPMVLDTSDRCTTCPPRQSYNFDNKRCIPDEINQEVTVKKNDVVIVNPILE